MSYPACEWTLHQRLRQIAIYEPVRPDTTQPPSGTNAAWGVKPSREPE
ncbi:hypothetical protein [Citrobacter amalonaticus]|nr:hypothetical protein [Citrobacter amalonaticus]